MPESAPTVRRWRVRWAEDQNVRRGQAYATGIDAWQAQDTDLRAIRQAAASFTGHRDGGSLPVALRGDERIYLRLAAVHAVQAPHVIGLPAVTAASIPAAAAGPAPAGIRVGDSGDVVVTSRRLLFVGPRHNREWSYAKLTGLIHDPTAPMTLMQVSNRKTTSGVLVQPSAVASFRFNLELAIADAAGDRDHLVAHLDQLIRDHDQLRPTPPPVAEPSQAPARAAWSPLRIAAAGAALFILLTSASAALLPDTAAQWATPASPALTTEATPTALPPPSSAPATASALAPKAAATTTAAQPKPKPKPTAKPAPKPKPVNLCGAPKNPLGYTFCGGSLIRSPEPDACIYFDCIDAFWDGKGYMIQCKDGMVSMSGGRQGSCSHHDGNRRTVHHRS